MHRNSLIIMLVVLVVSAASFVLNSASNKQPDRTPQDVSAPLPEGFVVPTLSAAATEGAKLFSQNCKSCHGTAATGTQNGPPLIHRIYEPNHHSDQAFYIAVASGTRQHHWPFGDMPAVEGVEQSEVTSIIAYVRSLQQANGIF